MVFRHYWWIALVSSLLAVGTILVLPTSEKTALVGSIIAVALGFCYFVQRQRVSRMSIFRKLFKDFNHRYDDMNDRLAQIAATKDSLHVDTRQKIVDYFNLCGEEYLFFTEGFIHAKAWQAWCRGMLQYFEQEPFRSVWEEERKTNSYYGLTLDQIRTGAGE
jgi:hypothetical protein